MLEENYKQPPTFQLQAILNWSEEVKRRVPAMVRIEGERITELAAQ